MVGENEGADGRPRQREGITLHVVESKREGTRWVLEDEYNGTYLELRGGERDAFIWERLDGTRTLHEISLEFLDAQGTLPRDMAGLVARLATEGFLDGVEAEPRERSAISRLGARVAIPGVGAVFSALAAPLAPLARSPVLLLVLLAGVAGLVFATYQRTLVGLRGTFLELDHVAWRGVVAIVFLNFLFSCLESLVRAAALRRGAKVRDAGLALPFGLPSLYVDDAPAIALPVEQRVVVHLAPLAVSLFLGGAASVGIFELLVRGGADPRVIELLGKVAWIGFLRALFHANPIGPSGVASALATWSGIEDLSAASKRFFTYDMFQSYGIWDGLDPRERILVAHGASSLAWLVLAARTLGWVVVGEVVPPFQSAVYSTSGGAASSPNMAALLVPLALAAIPLALVTGALLVAIARALRNAAASSTALSTPRGAAALAALVALLLAAQTAQLPTAHAAGHAALAGLLAALLALRVPSEDGKGRAALAITTIALAAAIETFAAIFVADAASRGEVREALRRGLAWMHTSARFLLLAGACFELGTASPLGKVVTPLGFLAALAGIAAGVLPFAAVHDKHLPPFFVDPALALGATLFFLTAFVASLGAHRSTSRGWFTLAALVLGASRSLPLLEKAQVKLPPTFAPASAEFAALTLGLGLLAAGLVARGRERKVRRFRVPVVLSEDRTARAVFERVLASMPLQADEHLGRGAADMIEARLAIPADGPSTAKTSEELADRALAAARRTSGERWLARFLDGALARVPSTERARVGRALASIPQLEATGLRAQDGAGPDDAVRLQLFRSVPILGPLADEDVAHLALLAVRERAALGETIVRQGEEGDRFYVVAKGEVQVSINGKDGYERTVAHLREGDAFGEGALLRHEPRAATVTASTPVDLLVLDRDVFLDFMRERKESLEKILDRLEDVWMVRSMGIFSELDGSQVAHLFARFRPMKALKGAAIIKQGDAGDRFFVVREGELEVKVSDEDGEREVATLGRGDYFGEMALLHDAPRAATVRATSDVELLALDRADFLESIEGRGRTRAVVASAKRAQELDG